ncbi:MAG: hypothetical protein L0228_01775 [Planctomycetes bacterium]|nr:hypothetical protein [Planctomycetota bacterium]
MFMSEMEKLGVCQSAIRQTAMKLGVVDVEWKSCDELLGEIETLDQKTGGLLGAFLNAFVEWFRFHHHNEKIGKNGRLDPAENEELVRLVDKRNRTRDALRNQLASIA